MDDLRVDQVGHDTGGLESGAEQVVLGDALEEANLEVVWQPGGSGATDAERNTRNAGVTRKDVGELVVAERELGGIDDMAARGRAPGPGRSSSTGHGGPARVLRARCARRALQASSGRRHRPRVANGSPTCRTDRPLTPLTMPSALRSSTTRWRSTSSAPARRARPRARSPEPRAVPRARNPETPGPAAAPPGVAPRRPPSTGASAADSRGRGPRRQDRGVAGPRQGRCRGRGRGGRGCSCVGHLEAAEARSGTVLRVFIKERTRPAPRSIPALLGVFEREVRFYREVAPEVGVRVPRG